MSLAFVESHDNGIAVLSLKRDKMLPYLYCADCFSYLCLNGVS